MFITMLGDSTAYASIVFGTFFFWTARPDFPPEGAVHADATMIAVSAVAFVLAWAATVAARSTNRRQLQGTARSLLIAGVGLTVVAGGALAMAMWLPGMEPSSHAYPAIMAALVVWTVAHCGAGVVMLCYCLAGSWAGKLTPRYDADLCNVTLFWHFLCLMGLVAALMLGVFPRFVS
jgi:cytochrome c oxidase subunit 1/cytochrome c oxidase subunit I+III